MHNVGWALNPASQDSFALLERHKGKDHIGVYDLDSLTLIRVSEHRPYSYTAELTFTSSTMRCRQPMHKACLGRLVAATLPYGSLALM